MFCCKTSIQNSFFQRIIYIFFMLVYFGIKTESGYEPPNLENELQTSGSFQATY